MNLYTFITGLVLLFSCSSKEAVKDNNDNTNKAIKENTIDQSQKALKDTDTINSTNDSKEAEAISQLLINAGKWYSENKQLWQFNKLKKEDSIRTVIIQSAKESGFFTSSMISKIEANSTKPKFGEYFYGFQLGRLLKSFSSNDEVEIKNNLSIAEDSATYTTYFNKVLNDIPSNDEQFDWLLESGPNKEKWLFTVQLVKQNGSWKINQLTRKFGIYNK